MIAASQWMVSGGLIPRIWTRDHWFDDSWIRRL